MTWRVWFHRSRAIAWAVVGVLSFVFGWADSIVLVWVASLYANVASDWSASEAADDSAVLEALQRVEQRLERLENR